MNNEKAHPHLRDDSGMTLRDYFAADYASVAIRFRLATRHGHQGHCTRRIQDGRRNDEGERERRMSFRSTTVKYIKDILRSKTISEVIYAELQEAHLRKLEAETASEYAHAAIQYNEQRIARLMARLTEHTEEGEYA
jgi:hypothetical protein